MICPDVNLLLHAYNRGSSSQESAKTWWEGCLNGAEPVGLAWVTLLGFLRISTRPGLSENPLSVPVACRVVRSWLARSQVSILSPGSRHASIFLGFLEELGVAGNRTTDAHLAALALEHGAALYSTDRDFKRFPGVHWINPLAPA